MRIKVKIAEPNEARDSLTLRTWMSRHRDNQVDFIIVGCPQGDCLTFQFTFAEILGCHRLFIYDQTHDCLKMFETIDLIDACEWIFEQCDKFICRDYVIFM